VKKVLIVLAVLLFVVLVALVPSVTFAATNDVCVLGPSTPQDECWSPTGKEIDRQTELRDESNATVCAAAGLPPSCTQAQYDTACAGVPECDASAIVYTPDSAGLREFYRDKLQAGSLREAARGDAELKGRASNAWNANGENVAPSAMCTAVGLSAGCLRREVTCVVLEMDVDCREP
jgi:hypothetical protein